MHARLPALGGSSAGHSSVATSAVAWQARPRQGWDSLDRERVKLLVLIASTLDMDDAQRRCGHTKAVQRISSKCKSVRPWRQTMGGAHVDLLALGFLFQDLCLSLARSNGQDRLSRLGGSKRVLQSRCMQTSASAPMQKHASRSHYNKLADLLTRGSETSTFANS